MEFGVVFKTTVIVALGFNEANSLYHKDVWRGDGDVLPWIVVRMVRTRASSYVVHELFWGRARKRCARRCRMRLLERQGKKKFLEADAMVAFATRRPMSGIEPGACCCARCS